MSENTENTLQRLPRFKPRGGIQVMLASIRALFLRELQTRFGHYRIGYVWAFLEPALNVIFMLILFGAIVKRVLPGIDYTVFLINGILPYYAFMRSVTQSIPAIEANRGLLSYRNVRPIDTVIARTGLEFVLYFVCYLLLSAVMLWIGFSISFSFIPSLLFYWLCLIGLTLGVASIMMVVGELSKEIGKLVSSVSIILYFMSGAMFPLHFVPEQYLKYFMWNPLAHLFELMRNAVSPNYHVVQGVSLGYVLICMLVVLFLGLLLNQSLSERLMKTK